MSALNIPSFDDFLAEMGEDRQREWGEEANAALEKLMPVSAPITAEGASEFATAMAAWNHRYFAAMLRDYHDWLAEQLARISLRLLK